MSNSLLYQKRKELIQQINEIMFPRTVNISFKQEDNSFFCYFCHNTTLDYNVYVMFDKKTNNMRCKIHAEFETKQKFERWFNQKGQKLFKELYELLKSLSPSEQEAFSSYDMN